MRSGDTSTETFSREIYEAVPDALLLVDHEGRIRDGNRRVTELFGYERVEYVGEPIELLVPGALREEHIDLRDSYLADPVHRPMGVGLDIVAKRKDGSTFPASISLNPTDVDGDTGVVAAIRDVTEQAALRTKYRALLETAPDAFIVADAATGDLTEVNDAAVELTGYTEAELLEMNQTDLHPSGETDRYQAFFDEHVGMEGIRSEFPDGSPVYVETSDGLHVPVEISAKVFELGDQRLVTGVFRDISESRDRERELERAETVIQASGDAVYMLDAAGRFTFVNESIERLTGFDEEDLLGEHVSKVLRQSDVETGEALIRRLLRSDRDRGTFELELRTADGESIPMENHIAILESGGGELEASVGVIRDVSEQKARERELERQNQRLDEFAGVVSHDLQNPLTVAIGHLELAMGECDSDRLEDVQYAHDRMKEIIQNTLTLAREGETVGDTDPVDLPELVEGCWQNVAADGVGLEVEPLPTIRADRSRLQHLFENLFGNAVAHGGPDVTVEVGGLEDGFYVGDTGPGIPASERDSVFEAGYSNATEGTGLGLTIVNRIVEAHDWEIEVTENGDGGARFEVTGVETVERA